MSVRDMKKMLSTVNTQGNKNQNYTLLQSEWVLLKRLAMLWRRNVSLGTVVMWVGQSLWETYSILK